MSKSAEKKGRKKRVNYFATPYTLINAVKEGGLATKISLLVMGAGNIAHKQILKGLLFLALEVAYFWYMINTGFHCIAMLPSLGDNAGEEVWNEAKGIYEYTAGDNSILILLYGVVAIAITVAFILLWKASEIGRAHV